MSLPSTQFLHLFRKHIPDLQFIETGTFRGQTVGAALRLGFRHVQSIEAVRSFYDDCCTKYSEEIASGLVKLHYGGSETVLPKIVKKLDISTLYWLDAHRQGREAEIKVMSWPLVVETRAICEHRRGTDDVILIDDLRLVGKQGPADNPGVVLKEVIGSLGVAFPDHFVCRVDGYTVNDVLAVVPNRLARPFFALKHSLEAAGRITRP